MHFQTQSLSNKFLLGRFLYVIKSLYICNPYQPLIQGAKTK